MNGPNFLSKWRWWLLGGLAMTGIGGWYAFEFQSQQRHAAVSPTTAPSVPLPIQSVSPSLTQNNTVVKPITPVTPAKNAIGGGTVVPPSQANSTLPATDAIPQADVTAPKAPAAEGVPSNLAHSGATTPVQPVQPQPSVSSPPARSSSTKVVTKSHPTTQSHAFVAKPHSSLPSKAGSQQAKVIKPAATAPVGTDDLGGNAPPPSTPKSTFMAEEKVRFGTSSAAPGAQAYTPAKNNALPALEPSRISTSPSAPSQSISPVGSGGSSAAGSGDLQLPRDEGKP